MELRHEAPYFLLYFIYFYFKRQVAAIHRCCRITVCHPKGGKVLETLFLGQTVYGL